MTLTPGARLGPYEIVAPLGAGGMGEVYRARDTQLKRDVALKVLPADVATDPDRLARFQREAELLAALNHPHIAQIYGLAEADGVRALVMELVEGETLAARIARGPVPLDEALPLAQQVAEALEFAHEHRIIHRDLKPANITLTLDGAVKVLDFGLAKALEARPATGDPSESPTMTSPAMTQAGIILGTAAYMSPEQARGKLADRRADIWAFGVVLYELLTGRAAFPGETITDVLGAIVHKEPDWSALPAATPPPVRRLLSRCLTKDPKQRLRDIGEARIELARLKAGGADVMEAPAATSAAPLGVAVPIWKNAIAWIAAAAVVAAAVLAIPAIRHLRETPPLLPEMRTEISTPATDDPESFALSPDGRQIVFEASGDGTSRLWRRFLASTTAQPLAGTEGATSPFWSPDSQSVGFIADSKLKRIDLGGGAPQTLAPAVSRGGSWNADGVVLFTPTVSSQLFRVRASGGGQAVAVTTLDRQTSHRFPCFLPDGRQFLFYALGTPDTAGIYLGSLDSPDTHRVTAAETAGVYLPSGWLLWVRAGTLVAQRLDLERKALAGDPVTLADAVAVDTTGRTGASAVSVSAAGLVSYRTGGGSRRQLAWFDRSGKALGPMGPPDENGLSTPSVSRDGCRVAVIRTVQGNADIWVVDAVHTTRLTTDAASHGSPVWSDDGSRVGFSSNRKGHLDLYQKASSGGGAEDLLLESPQDKAGYDWSADGRFVMYSSADPQTDWDLWVLPMDGDRRKPKPWVFLNTSFREFAGQFSPNGRWVAYMSDESGRLEIWIRRFAAPTASGAAATPAAGEWQVSTAGGIHPRWNHDGSELYYLGPTGAMMAAAITDTGTTLTRGAPVELFRKRIYGGGVDNQLGRQYDVTRDGRFLINLVLDVASAPITLVQNWNPAVKK
jgi:Tol biopolymer transport system component